MSRPMMPRTTISRPIPASALLLAASAALALAGCSMKTHGDNGEEASITIGGGGNTEGSNGATANGQQSMSIDVPGFSAKMNVPDLDIGGDTKIEDMPLYPGTKVNGVNISAHDGADSRGDVTMAFTAPAGTDKLIAWYRDQADKHGWTAVPATGANQFEAAKQEDGHGVTHFALQAQSATGGSSGRFIVTGR